MSATEGPVYDAAAAAAAVSGDVSHVGHGDGTLRRLSRRSKSGNGHSSSPGQ